MSVVFTLLIISFIGSLGARRPDIDINRVRLLPKEDLRFYTPSYHSRRSISDQYIKRNDYDHHSGRGAHLRAPLHFFYYAPSVTETPADKIHPPREDPRLFYQSDAYIKENNRKNLNNEVSSVYLERGVVQAHANSYRPLPIGLTDNEINSVAELCVPCPQDRTLITKAGLDRALLQYPHLKTCAGRKPPKDTHFVHMYGPKFGSLLKEGSHMVVGRITHRSDILQTCKMQIHVLIQTCTVPKYLITGCGDQNKICNFTCRNPKAEIRGHKTLTCGDDLKWSARLPVCSVRTWCAPPPPPDHSKLVCQGNTLANGWSLVEGARCRVQCDRGWRSSNRAISICRRGLWSRELKCQPKRTNK